MNLFYLIAKEAPRFRRSNQARKFRLERNGLVWRGARVEPGGSIYLQGATECEPFRSRCGCPGWFAQSLGGATEISLRFLAGGDVFGERQLALWKKGFEPVVLPWPLDPTNLVLDLEIACLGPEPAFIASNFEIDRGDLIARAKGRGVELGPGPNPHVKPSEFTEVFYVEQKAQEEWKSLYGDHYKMAFDPSLAPFYVVGEAHQIPVEPESLDFIYSSHVFEHLVNPLGHLELWSRLLRKGGEVLMVVPDYIGSKDFLASASTMESILKEREQGSFAPSMHHYDRYAAARGTPKKARKLFDLKSSIHMHYYSNANMRELLQHVVSAGLFEKFSILHSDNAKDFHVVLAK
jgi:SAM-dependent methyltransferase